ncbi:MAG: cysteine synthase family protein [Edaphobacter sp.]|uniref:PLP-dependent cysteine synthase family protein n=1 Tax=Edaphobacter sp. TaxID=1934404 RepID=UPI0023973B62|nr:cysteine synthase family protein [Edaphobacter sp.]MDE1176763.1 cysteine synthase family protein [Edaphobacter sp.]
MATRQSGQLEALSRLVGHTPLLEIALTIDGEPRRVFTKCEWKNLTGSIKDRMALHILREAYASGALRPGDCIVEATSGNTGISFSAMGRALGHKVVIFMPDWMSQERIRLMRSYGADVRLVSKAEGGFLGSIAMAEATAASSPNIFLPRQFSNLANVEAHRCGTALELCQQLATLDLRPDAFVAGVGTGGTVMGVGSYLREHVPHATVHPIEPAESPTLSTGTKVGHHRIQGISDEFIPQIVQLDRLDRTLAVSDGDAIRMAQRLCNELGLGVGISSGANLIGAVEVALAMGPDAVVATVFADDNKKYLSTDLTAEEPIREAHLTQRIQLLGMRVI